MSAKGRQSCAVVFLCFRLPPVVGIVWGGGAANSWATEWLGGYHHGRLPIRQPLELFQQCVQCSVMVFSQGLEPFRII